MMNNNNKEKRICVRLNEYQYKELAQRAEADNESQSVYIRKVLDKSLMNLNQTPECDPDIKAHVLKELLRIPAIIKESKCNISNEAMKEINAKLGEVWEILQ